MDEQLMRAMLAVDEHHWWYRGRRRVIDAELDRLPLPATPSILDAGCGSGRTMVELAKRGPTQGVELDEDALSLARSRDVGEVAHGRLEQLPYEDRSFDLITCLDVIEHIEDDVRALRELRRVSRPGGWLLVTVPAYPALWSRHDLANHHHRRYTRRTLAAAAQAGGWRIARTTSFNGALLAPAAVIRLAARRRTIEDGYTPDLDLGPAWLNRALELPLRAEARWLAGGRAIPAGLSLLSVLRNPHAATR